jgi:hypothetical protein
MIYYWRSLPVVPSRTTSANTTLSVPIYYSYI